MLHLGGADSSVDAAPSSGVEPTAASPAEQTANLDAPLSDAPTTHVDSSGKQEASVHVERLRTVVHTTRAISTGWWLPMAQDKLRNNVRSRPLLVGAYTLSMLFVIVLIVLTFYEPNDESVRLKFSVPPADTIALGTVMPAWSVQLYGADGKGVSGQEIAVSVTPLQPVELTATLGDESFVTRSVSCIESNLRGRTASYAFDATICTPVLDGLLTGNVKTTDDNGRVTFDEMALIHGVPASYVVIVYAENSRLPRGYGYLRAFVTVIDAKPEIEIMRITGVVDSLAIGDTFSVDAAVSWVGVQEAFAAAVAFVAPVDLSRPSPFQAPSGARFGLRGPQVRGLVFRDPAAVIAGASAVNQTGPYRLSANVTITATLLASNTPESHIGLFFFGRFVTLLTHGFVDPSMGPPVVAPPVRIRAVDVATVVAAVSSGGSGGAGLHYMNITESADVVVTVTVTDAAGAPVAGKAAFAYLEADPRENPTLVGSLAADHPLWESKQLYQGAAPVPTSAAGTVDVPIRVTSADGIGVYRLYVVVDGVFATWPIVAAGGGAAHGPPFLPVRILSEVARIEATLTAAPWLPLSTGGHAETLGQPWARRPAVRVLDASGAPVPGKRLSLRALRPAGVAVIAPPALGDDEGVSSFSFIMVTAAPAVALGNPVDVHFELCVDRTAMCETITVTILPPTAAVSAENNVPILANGTCATMDPVDLPALGYAAVAFNTTILVRDLYGAPAPDQVITFSLYPGLFPGFPAFAPAVTNATGHAVITIPGVFGVGYQGLPVAGRLYCYEWARLQSETLQRLGVDIVLPFVPRFADNVSVAIDAAQRTMTVSAMTVEWDAVTPQAPLSVALNPSWQPSQSAKYYGSASRLLASTYAILDAPPTGPVTVRWPGETAGSIYFSGAIDGAVIGAALTVKQPTVARLELVASALAGADSNGTAPDGTPIHSLASGTILSSRAQVRLFDGAGQVVPSGVVFIEFGTVGFTPASTGGGARVSVNWTDQTTAASAAIGVLVGFDPAINDVVVSAANASNGVATLPHLLLAGGDVSRLFAIRVCYTSDLRVSFAAGSSSARSTVCVNDTAYFSITPGSAITASVDRDVIYTIPSADLPPVTVTLGYADGSALFFTYLSAWSAAPGFRMLHRWSPLPGEPPGVIVTNTTDKDPAVPARLRYTVSLWDFTSAAVPGTYTLYIVAAGVSIPLSVVVSDAVENVYLEVPATNVAVGSVFTARATAISSSNLVMPGVPLELSLQRKQPPPPANGHRCVGESECGQLSPSATTYAETDGIGTAEFSLAFDSSATGSFVAAVRVAYGGVSDSLLSQLVRRNIQQLSFLLGVSRNELEHEVTRLSPIALDTIRILLSMLQQGNGVSSSASDDDDGTQLQDTSTSAGAAAAGAASTAAVYSKVFGLGKATSFAQKLAAVREAFFPAPTEAAVTASSTPVGIWNPCATVLVTREPSLSVTVVRSSESLEVLVGSASYDGAFDGATTPLVQLLDHNGEPLPHAEVTVTPNPATGLELSTDRVTADANGVVSLSGVRLRYAAAGEYSLDFSSRGSFGNATAKDGIRVAFRRLTVEETMKQYVWVVILSFAPMFVASVPHTRFAYSAVAGLFGVVMFALVVAFIATMWDGIAVNFFAKAYFATVGGYAGLLCLAQLGVLAVDFQSRVRRLPKWNFVNDETRALHTMRYARWITNARIDRQIEEDDAAAREARKKAPTGLKAKVDGKVGALQRRVDESVIGQLDETLQLELIDKTEQKRRALNLRRAHVERPPLRTPKDIKPGFVPFNLLLVFGVTLVLTFMNILFVLFLYLRMHDQLGRLLNYIPDPPNDTDMDEANAVLVQGISDALLLISRASPAFAFLSEIAVPLREVNLLAFLDYLRRIVTGVIDRSLAAFVIGTLSALGAIVGNIAMLTVTAPKQIQKIRRRELSGGAYSAPAVAKIEPYVGLHSLHFIVMFHLVFWPAVAVVFILLIAPIRSFIIDKVLLLVVASLGSLAVSLAMRYLVVNWLLINGWTVIRPQIYAVYSFMDLVLGVFSGIIGTITRLAQAIAFVALAFAKLDESVFPKSFQATDLAFKGYCSVLSSEAKNANPLMLVFATHLLVVRRLRQLQSEQEAEDGQDGVAEAASPDGVVVADDERSRGQHLLPDGPPASTKNTIGIPRVRVDVGTFGDGDVYQSGMVINLARMLVRLAVDAPIDLTDFVAAGDPASNLVAVSLPDARRNRMANRWRLALLLHFNPSLRKLRKHRLWVTDESEGDVAEGTGDSGVFGVNAAARGAETGIDAVGKPFVL